MGKRVRSIPLGGTLQVEAKNGKWNWMLFRIDNGIRPSDGTRFVGSIPANAQGAYLNGGVNGGTLRLESGPGLIVRVIAFDQRGAIGEPEQINTFFPPEQCDPEPETNLVFADIHNGTSQHMTVLNLDDQTTEIVVQQDQLGSPLQQRVQVADLRVLPSLRGTMQNRHKNGHKNGQPRVRNPIARSPSSG